MKVIFIESSKPSNRAVLNILRKAGKKAEAMYRKEELPIIDQDAPDLTDADASGEEDYAAHILFDSPLVSLRTCIQPSF